MDVLKGSKRGVVWLGPACLAGCRDPALTEKHTEAKGGTPAGGKYSTGEAWFFPATGRAHVPLSLRTCVLQPLWYSNPGFQAGSVTLVWL